MIDVQRLATLRGLRWRPRADLDIIVLLGDLTKCHADAIVNAANSKLLHGGGLAGACSRRGGLSIDEQSRMIIQKQGNVPVGSAVVTTAGNLPSRHIIHTVGPDIRSNNQAEPLPGDELLLEQAVTSALKVAESMKLQSIAIPGISSGIFGYPRDLAALVITKTCIAFCRNHEKSSIHQILLMNFDEPTVLSFHNALKSLSHGAAEPYDGYDFLSPREAASSMKIQTSTATEDTIDSSLDALQERLDKLLVGEVILGSKK